MTTKIKMIGLILAAALGAMAGEVEDALRAASAPGGEFVRMPAKYVLMKLEDAARSSGEPVLGGFSIEARLDGVDSARISVDLESMSVYDALMVVAEATGSRLILEDRAAALVAPGRVERREVRNVVVAPEEKTRDDDAEVAFSDVDNALVFVSTGAGRGSAFVAEMDGKVYILSNQHNFIGAKKLELRAMHGGLLEFESFEFSRTRDLARFELKAESLKDLAVLKLSNIAPTIAQEIAVYGNSAGGNVATELKGEVLGVGPRDIEIDADIVSGNSGSPILNNQGEVIGVATYVSFERKFSENDARKQIFKGTRFGKTRRYGVRIPADGWVKVDMRRFLEQSYALADFRNQLEIMHILTRYWSGLDDYEDYAGAANRIMAAYSSKSRKSDPPYEFHSARTEAEVEMMVKAFKRNFDEFRGMIRDMDLSRQDLAKLSRNEREGKASSKVGRVDYHIRTSTLSKTRALRDELSRREWMSDYLSGEAEPLERAANELVLLLEGKVDLTPRVRAVM